MELISGIPFGEWGIIILVLLLLLVLWRPWKKSGATALDPLDNSPLGDDTEDIHIQGPAGRVVTFTVNRQNAEKFRQSGLKHFPDFHLNLRQYAMRFHQHYRRNFEPQEYYFLGGETYYFESLLFWTMFDLYFGHTLEEPAFVNGPWHDEVYQEYYEEMDKLTPARLDPDPATLEEYLSGPSGREESIVIHEPPSHLEIEKAEPPHEHHPGSVREEDPLNLSPYLAGDSPKEVEKDDQVGLGSFLSGESAPEIKAEPEHAGVAEESSSVRETVTEHVEVSEPASYEPPDTPDTSSSGE